MRSCKKIAAFILALVMICGMIPFGVLAAQPSEQTEPQYPFLDTSLSFEERAADLVSRLTVEEKINLLSSRRAEGVVGIPRLGIEAWSWGGEAAHGLSWMNSGTPVSSFPTGLAMSSSWNPDLITEVGSAIADEARGLRKLIQETNNPDLAQLSGGALSFWAPTINLARDPRWGRSDDNYGEDPYLTAQTAGGFVNGMQGDDEKYLKTVPALKHFLANNSEWDRLFGNSVVDERSLREYYAKSFQELVENTGISQVMTAYNRVNGIPMAAHTDIVDTMLRKTWGFEGLVTTDCGAIGFMVNNHKWVPEGWDHSVDGAEAIALSMQAGTDVNCGTYYVTYGMEALERGLITEQDLDRALLRAFTERMKTGEFDPDEMVAYTQLDESELESDEHVQLTEDMAEETVVLLKNEPVADQGRLLPIDAEKVSKIAVVSEMADVIELGGYSEYSQTQTTTPIDGLTERVKELNPGAEVKLYTPKQGTATSPYLFNIDYFELKMKDGSTKKFTAADAELVNCVKEAAGNIGLIQPVGAYAKFTGQNIDLSEVESITVRACCHPQAMGGVIEAQYGTPNFEPDGNALACVEVGNTGGWGDPYWQNFEMKLNVGDAQMPQDGNLYFVFKSNGENMLSEADLQEIAEADVVIAYVGTRGSDSNEGRDRSSIELPRNQALLISDTLQANPNTIVYIQSCSQVDIESFKNEAPAILWCAPNGQQQGKAFASILLGDVNPSGRLSFTWYQDIDDLAWCTDMNDPAYEKNYQIRSDTADGSEGIKGRTYQYFTGDISYPFGYGLSYTDFEYSNMTIDKTSGTPDDTVKVTVDVTNAGAVPGKEVAQLYVVNPNADRVDRPAKQLRGFVKTDVLQPGETQSVTFEVPMEEIYYWDETAGRRAYDEGTYQFQVASSSADADVKDSREFAMSGQLTPELNVVTATPDAYIFDLEDGTAESKIDVTACKNDESFYEDLSALTVTYSSSRPEVVSVTDDGQLTAHASGTATITVEVSDGKATKSADFPVVVRDTSELTDIQITIDGELLDGFNADTHTYTVAAESGQIPQVDAAAASETVQISVTQAEAVPGDATVTVTSGARRIVYTIHFTCVVEQFDFTAMENKEDLLSDGWSVLSEEDAESWRVDPGQGVVITAQQGDIIQNQSGLKNLIGRDLPEGYENWTLEVQMDLSEQPTESFEQGAIMVYQDDDHYLKLSCEPSGAYTTCCKMLWEENGSFSTNSEQAFEGTNVYFRLSKEGDTYTGWMSMDGKSYVSLGSHTIALTDPKIALFTTYGNPPSNPTTKLEVTYKYLTFTSDEVPVSGVTLNKDAMTLEKGASEQLTATVEPANAANKNVTWSSSDETVATVDENGLVTAVAEGSATITAATANGLSAACTVTVQEPVAGKDLSVAVSGADTVKQDQRVPYTFSFSGEKENLGNVTVIFNVKGDPAGLFTGGAFEVAEGFSKYVMDEEEQADGSRRVKVVLAYGMDELTALEEAALTDELTDMFTYVIRSSAEQEGEIEVTVEQAIFTYAGDNDLYYADVTGATASTSVSSKDPYDIDGDGDFDQADITAAQGYYRAAEGDANWDEARKADVNRDGVVDLTDLVELATAWLDTL